MDSKVLQVSQEHTRRNNDLTEQFQQSRDERKAGRDLPLIIEEIITELKTELDESIQPRLIRW